MNIEKQAADARLKSQSNGKWVTTKPWVIVTKFRPDAIGLTQYFTCDGNPQSMLKAIQFNNKESAEAIMKLVQADPNIWEARQVEISQLVEKEST